MSTKTRFEKEAKGNSEMAYCTGPKRNIYCVGQVRNRFFTITAQILECSLANFSFVNNNTHEKITRF